MKTGRQPFGPGDLVICPSGKVAIIRMLREDGKYDADYQGERPDLCQTILDHRYIRLLAAHVDFE